MLQRGLLLDRDGVVNVDHGYVSKTEQFFFMPGLFPFLRAVQDRGYRLAIVTNQSGVARGLYTIADYEKLTHWMMGQLRAEGISIDLVLAAFEYKEGTVASLTRDSYWRKPNPGMILEAGQRLRLDLTRSAMIGDKERDMQAAQAAGVKNCLWLTEQPVSMPQVTPIRDFTEALQILA